ncbi:hypothetical protein HK098_002453 [Nowakowskiella sp. JEL0407]|nr:hypothetical protein HK098_002453 [Nowakowskiella sp. JEL0407]
MVELETLAKRGPDFGIAVDGDNEQNLYKIGQSSNFVKCGLEKYGQKKKKVDDDDDNNDKEDGDDETDSEQVAHSKKRKRGNHHNLNCIYFVPIPVHSLGKAELLIFKLMTKWRLKLKGNRELFALDDKEMQEIRALLELVFKIYRENDFIKCLIEKSDNEKCLEVRELELEVERYKSELIIKEKELELKDREIQLYKEKAEWYEKQCQDKRRI